MLALLALGIGWLFQQAWNFLGRGSHSLGRSLVFGLLRLVVNPFVPISLPS